MSHPTKIPPADPLKEDPDAIVAHRPYHRLVRRLLRWKGVPNRDIRYVHEEVFAAVLACLPSVERVESMEALFARTCFWRAATYLRQQRGRGRRKQYKGDGGSASDLQGILAPDRASTIEERAEVMDALLRRMGPELREVFVLVEIQEMGVREAVETLGIDESELRSRLGRARRRFEQLLGPVRAQLK